VLNPNPVRAAVVGSKFTNNSKTMAGNTDPSGNTANVLKDISGVNSKAINTFSDIIGFVADLSGVGAVIGAVIGLIDNFFNIGQPDLQAIQDAINKGFTQLGKEQEAAQILQRNTTLNGYMGPALTQLQTLQAEVNANPNPAEVVRFIEPCVTTLDDLSGAIQPDIVWNLTANWPIYWTDAGQYGSTCSDAPDSDVGYGPQNPPLNPDGLTVFYYVYSLPLYLFALSIFLTVGRSLDPNFATNYADVLRSAASVLKARHDQIKSGLKQLAPPNWTELGLMKTACGSGTPISGITLVRDLTVSIPGQAVGAIIEYGAVEIYSGASSIGDSYRLNFDFDATLRGFDTLPGTFNKLQLRLLKRSKDVYAAAGLGNVWQVIDNLNALVGDAPLSGPNFWDWSLRESFRLSDIAPSAGVLSLRALARFIIQTEPLDTPYTNVSPDVPVSLRNLLTNFQTNSRSVRP
jgi:hypothetical protein